MYFIEYLYLNNIFYFVSLDPRRGGECNKVAEPKYCSTDLHYNQTFVLEKDQSSETVLQIILDSKCSPELEKYLCYTTVPPCKPNDLSVFVPCRSICEQVGLHFILSNTANILHLTEVRDFSEVIMLCNMKSSHKL